MATVAIVGAGHVGVVYAAGLAELGHTVRVVDIDAGRVARLRRGDVWFHEPGLGELLARGVDRARITFTTDYREALLGARFAFICVPTPSTADGALDDRMIRAALEAIRANLDGVTPIVVNKSTVPIGSGDLAREMLREAAIHVVSNPEFLAEGRALEDFFHPSRIVIGASDRAAADEVAALYAGVDAPILFMDNASAEFTKLAANSFLALKVSFANALARLSEAVGADVDAVAQAISLDPRIGPGHLRAGLGFGGSCLPKDVAAMAHVARTYDANPELFAAVQRINVEQRRRVVSHLTDRLGSLDGRRVALLGLAFKAGTDDVRDSPGLALALELLERRADLAVYDPLVRMDVTSNGFRARAVASALAAARGADALVLATDWPEFAHLDLVNLRRAMSGAVLVDGRGLVSPVDATRAGFDYFGFGRGGRPRD